MNAVHLTRLGAALVFGGFAVSAWVSGWILRGEHTGPSLRDEGTRQQMLAFAYLVAAAVSLAGLLVRRDVRPGRRGAAARVAVVAGLCAVVFWLVDESQKFPLSDGPYGPKSLSLLALATLGLAGAVVIAVGPLTRRRGL